MCQAEEVEEQGLVCDAEVVQHNGGVVDACEPNIPGLVNSSQVSAEALECQMSLPAVTDDHTGFDHPEH